MNGRIACTFFSRKRQKLGEEVESFAFEYLGGLSGLLCTTPTVYSRVQRVVSGSRLCKLGVFFHAPAEPSSLFFTHTFSLRLEKFCDADNHIFVACGIKVKSWIRNNFSIYIRANFQPSLRFRDFFRPWKMRQNCDFCYCIIKIHCCIFWDCIRRKKRKIPNFLSSLWFIDWSLLPKLTKSLEDVICIPDMVLSWKCE